MNSPLQNYTRDFNFKHVLLGALLACFSGSALAEMSVDKSQGQLIITSDIDGLVIVKIIGPDDVVVVDDRYNGNSFSWSPSSGSDGAYRYDVRVIDQSNTESKQDQESESKTKSDYAGGSVEVTNGQIANYEEEVQ